MPSVSSLRRILVVFKMSKRERYSDRGTLRELPSDSDEDVRAVFERLDRAHAEHNRAVARIEEILEASGVEVVRASQPRKRDVVRADLVISVGGDGTFLWSARKVERVPMLGVNSAPASSTGHYCGYTVDTLPEALDAIRTGELRPSPLVRIRCTVGKRSLPYQALNEVLFAHLSPAGSTRYLLRVGDSAEMQLSSGLWLSTASGSTGAIHSAGGEVMDPDDQRLQYLVREPYRGRDEPRLVRGYTDGPVKIVSRSPSNAVFLDGNNVSFGVGFGSPVTLGRCAQPLMVYGYRGRWTPPGDRDRPPA